MKRTRYLAIALLGLGLALPLWAQAQPMDKLLQKMTYQVVQKYERTPCQDLRRQKMQPKPAASGLQVKIKQTVMQYLRDNPQKRAMFINQVAGPIANKMFACGMIP